MCMVEIGVPFVLKRASAISRTPWPSAFAMPCPRPEVVLDAVRRVLELGVTGRLQSRAGEALHLLEGHLLVAAECSQP